MTDKVQKIREEVEKLRIKNTESFDCIDSMQEEPVAPKLLKDMLNAKTAAESLGISQEEHDRIVDECIYGKEPELVDFDNLPKEEPVSEIDFEQELYKAFGQVKDFTLCLKIARRFYEIGRNHQEPVSEDLEKAAEQYATEFIEPFELYYTKDEVRQFEAQHEDSFKAGANWQKVKDESFSKDLGDYINELSKQFPEVSFAKLSRIAVRVAKWQKEQIKKSMDLGEPPYLISIEQAYYRTLKLLEE